MTAQQHRLLVYIDETIRKTGVCPSCAEMLTHVGLKSKSGIVRLVQALAADGYIIYRHKRARAIEVVRRPGAEASGVTLTQAEWQLVRWAIASYRRDMASWRLEAGALDALLEKHP